MASAGAARPTAVGHAIMEWVVSAESEQTNPFNGDETHALMVTVYDTVPAATVGRPREFVVYGLAAVPAPVTVSWIGSTCLSM